MAQGGKLKTNKKSKQKSAASVKKQQKKQLPKGRKALQAKGEKATSHKQIEAATKVINKKNEIKCSAKAMSAGNKFFLNDLQEKGKKEIHRANVNQEKKERGKNNLTSRLKNQLRKMGKDVR